MLELHPSLSPIESSAIKWVLLCAKYDLNPLEVSQYDFEFKKKD